MSNKNRNNEPASGDSAKVGEDTSLQKELNRESREGDDSVGDVGSNRNLSGSSTWETLPGDRKSSSGSQGEEKTPKR